MPFNQATCLVHHNLYTSNLTMLGNCIHHTFHILSLLDPSIFLNTLFSNICSYSQVRNHILHSGVTICTSAFNLYQQSSNRNIKATTGCVFQHCKLTYFLHEKPCLQNRISLSYFSNAYKC